MAQRGELVASSDWIAAAFSPQKHYLKPETLESSTLRFLSEDAESRWRSFLDSWEGEENYQRRVDIGAQAELMRRVDSLLEIFEERYKRLREKSDEAREKLLTARANLDKLEKRIEKAERSNEVGELLKFGSALSRQREEMEDSRYWPEVYVAECDKLLSPLTEMVSARIPPPKSLISATAWKKRSLASRIWTLSARPITWNVNRNAPLCRSMSGKNLNSRWTRAPTIRASQTPPNRRQFGSLKTASPMANGLLRAFKPPKQC